MAQTLQQLALSLPRCRLLPGRPCVLAFAPPFPRQPSPNKRAAPSCLIRVIWWRRPSHRHGSSHLGISLRFQSFLNHLALRIAYVRRERFECLPHTLGKVSGVPPRRCPGCGSMVLGSYCVDLVKRRSRQKQFLDFFLLSALDERLVLNQTLVRLTRHLLPGLLIAGDRRLLRCYSRGWSSRHPTPHGEAAGLKETRRTS
mmetsp:Transcript_12230/g.26226  ORF Transcript_12230/g.26226 Transcript_12230/m.26226 type:complete len:200 (-) Transcript_12230:942-1541(-)